MSNDIKRAINDINGNSRFIIHWLTFLHPEPSRPRETYESVLQAARKAGGRKYRGRDFGGGIVFQCQEFQLPKIISLVRSYL